MICNINYDPVPGKIFPAQRYAMKCNAILNLICNGMQSNATLDT
jgi:hypothetical protein